MLPPHRRAKTKAAPKRTLATFALNAFMVTSGLALLFLVLMQEERFAVGKPGYLVDAAALFGGAADNGGQPQ
jgi:hypothetical protein